MPGPDAPVKPAPRTERIAVVVRDVAAGVEFRAPEPVKSDAPQIMEESIKKGAVFGSIEAMERDPSGIGVCGRGLIERALEPGRARIFRDGFHHETGTGGVFAGGSFSSQA